MKFAPEGPARDVRIVLESLGSATRSGRRWSMVSIAAKIGCTAEKLSRGACRTERNFGQRHDLTTVDAYQGD